MQYQALYRKYRPQRFDQVVGQDHVTRTIAREIVDEKTAHAYLFAGPRGTGKTTTARLLAKALNCENRQADGEPCNECASCVAITEGSSLDVIELDAASHNKVEDIREIRVNVGTVAAAAGAHRVYILDEAHMLSRAAGNALLKTLEEPPEHVVFVLATTEPYKLLDTIRSRAQRFDFHPVGAEILIDYLGEIAKREGFDAEHEGLAAVANHARGSVRDGLSLIEQVAALGGGSVTVEGVSRALGLADSDAYAALAKAIAEQDAPTALGIVARLSSQGADLRRFVAESLAFFRGIFLAQYAPNLDEVVDEPPEVVEEWRQYAGELQPADVLRAIDQLADALLELRQGREERLVVELAMLRLVRPETALDAASVSSRMDHLERRVKGLEGGAVEIERPTEEIQEVAVVATEAPVATEEEPPVIEEAPASTDVDVSLGDVESIWPALVARVRSDSGPRRHALLMVATPIAVTGSTITLGVPAHQHFHLEQLQADDDFRGSLADLTGELLGTPVALDFRATEDSAVPEPAEPARAPDKEQLLEAGDGSGDDPADLVVDILGGEVVTD